MPCGASGSAPPRVGTIIGLTSISGAKGAAHTTLKESLMRIRPVLVGVAAMACIAAPGAAADAYPGPGPEPINSLHGSACRSPLSPAPASRRFLR